MCGMMSYVRATTRLLSILAILVMALGYLGPLAQPAEAACQGGTTNVTFIGKTCSGGICTWQWQLCQNSQQALSHWVLGICDNVSNTITQVGYTDDDGNTTIIAKSYGLDPPTGFTGLKWDTPNGPSGGECWTLFFKTNQDYPTASLGWASKFDACAPGTGTVTSPACTPCAVDCTITAASPVCAGSTGNAASTATSGATYQWGITGGTITSSSTIQNITYTAGTGSNVGLSVNVTKNSCTASCNKTITINTLPDCTITCDPPGCTICAGSSITLSAPTGTGYTYSWSTGATTASITVSPTVTTQYSVNVTAGGCKSTCYKTVTVNPLPDCTITAASPVCAGSTGNIASTATAGADSYLWTITGGTITSANNTQQITYTAGNGSSLTLSVTVNQGGCSNTCNQPVTLQPCVGPQSTLTVFKYFDVNGDGTFNGQDYPLSGWQICANGTCNTTNANGIAIFNLPPGNYNICETLPSGWTNTEPGISPPCYGVSLTGGEQLTFNFGNRQAAGPGQIRVFKFNDANGDGIYNNADAPIGGWQFCINGDCKATGASGYTSYWDLPPGTYTVCETPQFGWVNIKPGNYPACYTVNLASDQQVTLAFANFHPVTPPPSPPIVVGGTVASDDQAAAVLSWGIVAGLLALLVTTGLLIRKRI